MNIHLLQGGQITFYVFNLRDEQSEVIFHNAATSELQHQRPVLVRLGMCGKSGTGIRQFEDRQHFVAVTGNLRCLFNQRSNRAMAN